jgi:arginine deiminase
MAQATGADSEVGQLRTVLMHRPGPELQRLTPRHRDRVLLRTLPWLGRARQEHDVLSQVLRDEGAEVLYLMQLLQDCLEYQSARDEAIGLAVADAGLGDELRGQLRGQLEGLGPESLAQVLVAGLTPAELKLGHGVVFELLDRHDFVLDPLPNLVFTRDSSFWIGDQIAVASMAAPRRRREAGLAGVIYRHHPRFAGTKWLYQPELEPLDGGDVLMLSVGVIAVGVGERTTAAAAERLAGNLFDAGLAHTVLAVPMSQRGGNGHLDTACALIDADSVIMHPAVAYTLTAHAITCGPDGLRISRRRPFLEAAAQAMGIERLQVVDTGTEAAADEDHWDDGANILAVGCRVAVSHERNSRTNARLEDAGIRVLRVPSSELSSVRGGPRCMACPVSREAAPASSRLDADISESLFRETVRLAPAEAATVRLGGWPDAPVPATTAASQSQGSAGELASASLGGRCRYRRRPNRRADLRPTRKTPKSRPIAKMISASVASHSSACTMATTTRTATIAPAISSKRRSMNPRYGPEPSVSAPGSGTDSHIYGFALTETAK